MIEISTIRELLSYLYQMEVKSGSYCFRGESNYDWKLLPSIHREYIGFKKYQTVINESIMFGQLKGRELPHIYTDHPMEILIMCQHYNFHTRLLDWSNDILVALYFACSDSNHFDQDGSLYILNKNAYDKYDFGDPGDIQKHTAPLIVDTHIINPRMRAQSGCFILWSTHLLDKTSSETYDLVEYNEKNHEQFLKNRIEQPLIKIRIPKNKKEDLLDELNELYGISRPTIFLENEFGKENEKFYSQLRDEMDSLTEYLTEKKNKSEET